MIEKFCLDWPQAWSAGVAHVGGKGWNLSRLVRYGFPVPAGGVLTTAAWDLFAAANHVQLPSDEDESTLAALRTHILQAPLPPSLSTAIAVALAAWGLETTALAVRSSAVAEDSAQASCAGIYASTLNVRGLPAVLTAIRHCWASAWTPQAVAYRRRMAIPDAHALPAVVLMALVAPAGDGYAAGVAFSCDPRDGREDRVFIAANFGLGESVVGGQADPDEYVVDVGFHAPTWQIVERRQGRREYRSELRAEGGTTLVATQPEPTRWVLSDELLFAVTRLTRRTADALGHGEQPQDIEWVYDGQQLHIVQARPVTTRPTYTYPALADHPICWSNGNFRDAMPMVQTPLQWTLSEFPIDTILRASCRAAGYRTLPGARRARLYQGRGYFDVSLLQWEYYHVFGIPPEKTNFLMGGHQEALTVPSATWMQRFGWLKHNLTLTRHALAARRRVAVLHELLTQMQHERQQDWHGVSEHALLERLYRGLADFATQQDVHLLLSVSAGSYMALALLLNRYCPGQGERLANGLLIDGAPITSAEHGYRLAELAATADHDAKAQAFFAAEPFTPAHWTALPSHSPFRQAFAAFLADYGHRAVYELDMSNPRWHEDPSWLLETIRSMVGTAALQQQAEQRQRTATAVQAEIQAHIPRWLRGVVRYLAKQAAREAAQREQAKSVIAALSDLQRTVILQLGQRLTARGLLTEPTAVFYLTLDDLSALLSDTWDGHGITALIADRQQRQQQLSTQAAPELIMGEQPQRRSLSVEWRPEGAAYKGLGVAAGQATGRARLMTHPGQGARLASGEILVAPSTDPGWTPLFLRAAALVTETGGFISHGAIVAREYGIPAVVNVADVMTQLPDGAPVIVDGDRGYVVVRTAS